MLEHVKKRDIPATVCTIYNPNFDHPQQKRMCETALVLLNHVIVTESAKVRTHP
jgi:hypothetical protein